MIKKILCLNDEKKELKKFALSFFIVTLLWGSLLLWRGKDFYFFFYCLSFYSIVGFFFIPIIVAPIKCLLHSVLFAINFLFTKLVLIFMYYLVFSLISFFSKIFGKSFLENKIDIQKDTYWEKVDKIVDNQYYERQF